MQNSQLQTKSNENMLKKLQKNVTTIYRQRRRICQEITDKTKQKKIFTLHQQKPKTQEQLQCLSKHDNLRKIVKRQSQTLIKKQSQNQEQIKSTISLQQKPQEFQKKQKPHVSSQALNDRNKRIFGGLTNHLKKAGAHLQSKQQKQKTQHAKQILNKVIEKEKQERLQMQNKKKDQLQARLTFLQRQRKLNEQKMNKAQNQLLGQIVKSHFNALGNFYMTRTEPKVFWKPKVPFEDIQRVQKIKSYGEKYLKRQEQEYLDKINTYNSVFQHGKYMTQNQRQFYSNYVNNMYLDHKNFIMTKTEPRIFWKPKKSNQTLESKILQTVKHLDEKASILSTHNASFYETREKHVIEQHENNQFEADLQEDEQKLE